jgi:UPF0755 protein
MGAKAIIEAMVTQFRKRFTPEMKKRTEELGMTIPQVVTLASIIGKQTAFKDEKPLVSAVFHNRLKKRMRLQSDMTAIYGLKREGKLVKKGSEYYRKSYTLYNTYMIDGLPPGPIANPDIDSLQAALYPASVNYLYLEANKDFTHNFSTSIDTHGAYKRKRH